MGLMAYPDPRGERNNRMPAKRRSAQVSGPGCRGTRVIRRKSAWTAAHPRAMKCLLQSLGEAQAISLGDAPGAVADSILEAVEPVESLAQGRGTSDCRYEHEPQLRF